MEKKRSVGLAIMSAIEGMIGLIGLWGLGDLLTYKMRTGNEAGIGWLILPMVIALSLFVLLSVGIALRKKVAWHAHLVLIPLILLCVIGFGIMTNSFDIIVILPLVAGIVILIYLCFPKVKEQFK